jgi:hypothetical protein
VCAPRSQRWMICARQVATTSQIDGGRKLDAIRARRDVLEEDQPGAGESRRAHQCPFRRARPPGRPASATRARRPLEQVGGPQRAAPGDGRAPQRASISSKLSPIRHRNRWLCARSTGLIGVRAPVAQWIERRHPEPDRLSVVAARVGPRAKRVEFYALRAGDGFVLPLVGTRSHGRSSSAATCKGRTARK